MKQGGANRMVRPALGFLFGKERLVDQRFKEVMGPAGTDALAVTLTLRVSPLIDLAEKPLTTGM